MRAASSPHVVIVAAGYGLGAALYAALPDEAPFARPLAAFLLPTAAAVTYTLLRGLCARHPIGAATAGDTLAAYDAVMLRFVLFLMAVHATMLVGLMGLFRDRPWTGRIVPALLGLAMIGIGNLLPRTRPNLAIGIRSRRTLSDRACWIRVHRSAGYMTVACGAVIVLSAIAGPRPFGPGMILLVGPAALLGTWLLVRFSGRDAHA
jgi:uncharacterized membrane protein